MFDNQQSVTITGLLLVSGGGFWHHLWISVKCDGCTMEEHQVSFQDVIFLSSSAFGVTVLKAGTFTGY